MFDQFSKYFMKNPSSLAIYIRVNKSSYYQSLQLNHSLQLNYTKIADNN